MKLTYFLLPVLLIVAVSCSKNNNSSRPQLKIKSINSPIGLGGGLNAILEFNSTSGKVGQGTFVAIRNRLNQKPLPINSGSADTVTGPVPNFPDQTKGEFQFQLDYSYLHESSVENDTVVFKFALIDRAGKSSDTIVSPKIVILYQ